MSPSGGSIWASTGDGTNDLMFLWPFFEPTLQAVKNLYLYERPEPALRTLGILQDVAQRCFKLGEDITVFHSVGSHRPLATGRKC